MNVTITSDKITYNLGPLDRLPYGEGRTFQVDDQQIAVFRTRKNELFATQALCSHKGGPLADGIVGDGKIVCPLHAFKFQLATGDAVGNSCPALRTYTVTVSDFGDILLELDADRA